MPFRRAKAHAGAYWLGPGDIEGETSRSGRRRVYVKGVVWISGPGFENACRMVDHVEAVARGFAPRPTKWRKQ